MKKIHRVLVLLLAALMALSLITTAFAEPTIDPGKKASLSIYKYDITKASNDGAWDAESYVSAGLHDDAVRAMYVSDTHSSASCALDRILREIFVQSLPYFSSVREMAS